MGFFGGVSPAPKAVVFTGSVALVASHVPMDPPSYNTILANVITTSDPNEILTGGGVTLVEGFRIICYQLTVNSLAAAGGQLLLDGSSTSTNSGDSLLTSYVDTFGIKFNGEITGFIDNPSYGFISVPDWYIDQNTGVNLTTFSFSLFVGAWP